VAWHPLRNEFLVVWADGHWDWWNTTLYGEILNTAGATVDDLTITSTLDGRCEEPQVAYASSAHGWLVVWEQEQSLSNHDIYRRLFSGGGSPLESAQQVAAESHSEKTPAVVAGETAQALVVWQDTRDAAAKGVDLYMTVTVFPITTFTGHVYKGASGETDQPLQGVGVALSCSNDAGNLGSEIDATTTNKDGRTR